MRLQCYPVVMARMTSMLLRWYALIARLVDRLSQQRLYFASQTALSAKQATLFKRLTNMLGYAV
jgi:hypothetical protein